MARKDQNQIGVTFSSKEREIIEQIANDLGRSISSVVRDAAIRGLPAIIKDYEALKPMIKGENNDSE